jgi:hypothetical protein
MPFSGWMVMCSNPAASNRVSNWPVRATMALSTKAVVSTSGCKYLIKPLVALLPIPVTGAGAAPEISFKIAIKQQAPCLSGRRGGGQLSLRVIRQALPREEQLWQALADVEPHQPTVDRATACTWAREIVPSCFVLWNIASVPWH